MNERDIFLAALDHKDHVARDNFVREACGEQPELLERVQALFKAHKSARANQFLNMPAIQQIAEQPPGGNGPGVAAAYDSSRNGEGTMLLGDTQGECPEETTPTSDEDSEDFSDWGSESGEDVLLGYLQPTTKPGSLGRLGHYEILEAIGRGAFGTVLRAFDDKLERIVAIKILAPEMAATSPARKRFLREARSSAQVRHENVVSVYAVEDVPIPYLVMEYVPGQTLQQRLDEHGPLNLVDVLRLGKQIADGLAAAHDRQLIHRDVKPGNILLETMVDDHVKITDFGLARTADDASMTQSGMIAGTPMFMAPEQALGKKIDSRSDLFSFGSVLYQMLSGRPPFRAPSAVAVLKRVVEETPRPIPDIIPEVPQWMCQLIGHLHAKDPNQRYGSAKEVSALLARCLEDLKEGRKPHLPAPRMPAEGASVQLTKSALVPDRRRIPRKVFVVVAILLLLVSCFGVTEATGVTRLTSTVVRLTTGSGTLEIETNDPNVKIDVNGEQVSIHGAGVPKLTVRPGQQHVAEKGDPPKRSEIVAITPSGRTTVRMAPDTNIGIGLSKNWSLKEIIRVGPEVDRLLAEGGFNVRNRHDFYPMAAAMGRAADWPRAGKLLDKYLEAPGDSHWHWAHRCYVAASIQDWATYEHGCRQFALVAESFRDDIHSNIVAAVILSSHGPSEGRLAKARKFADHLAERWPGDKETLYAEAWVQYATGDSARAQQHLEQIPDRFGNLHFRISKTLLAAKCAAKIGDQERAEELLDRASEWLMPMCASGDLGDPDCWGIARGLALLRSAEFDIRGAATTPRVTPQQLTEWAAGESFTYLTAAEQVERVFKELKRRNPRFDGKWWKSNIENGVLTSLQFCTDNVTDITPVKRLPQLRTLHLHGDLGNGSLADLSPLRGMKLTSLEIPLNQVVDLSPLRGMPLKNLHLMGCPVSDLTPLEGMPLRALEISRRDHQVDLAPLAGMPLEFLCLDWTPVSDLTPLKNLPLTRLRCYHTGVSDLTPLHDMRLTELHVGMSKVTDLSPIKGMPLEQIKCDFKPERDSVILRELKTLKEINDKPAAEFWGEVNDAGTLVDTGQPKSNE